MQTGNPSEISLSRNKFEAFLKASKPQGYRQYIKVKKEALALGEDPLRRFRGVVAEVLGERKAMNFWFLAVGKRLVQVEEEDVEFIRGALKDRKVDLDVLVELLGGDRRKVADVICALHLDKLKGLEYPSMYMVVDKLISTRGKGAYVPPAPGRIFFDEIPEGLIEGNVDAFEILKTYGIEEYQREFQLDYGNALEGLRKRIERCEDPTKKSILLEIERYFVELDDLEIPGIVDMIIDRETGELVNFPAVHQKVGARFIAEKMRALIADEMGLGKTAQAVIAKNLIEKKEKRRITGVAVVPNNVLAQWREQIGIWNTEEKSVVEIRSASKEDDIARALSEQPDFVLVSYDMVFRKANGGTVGEQLQKICDYLILDEVHNAKEAASLRSSEILKLSQSAEYVAMLSGTPVPNRISDLGVVASILWEHEFMPEDFNRQYRKSPRVVREKILPKMLRRRKRETFGERQCTRHEVRVRMTDAQQKAHERLELNPDGMGSLGLIAQLRRCALDPALVGLDEESPKYEKLAEMLVDHHDGSPAVVFSSELKEGVLDKLCSKLEDIGFDVARIDGDPVRSGKNRDRILRDFSQGKYDVVVATLATLGEGVDKLTISHRGYFIDVPFTEARLGQGIARLDRKGQKEPVDIYILVSENSIDDLLLRLIEQKKLLGEFLIDGMELTELERRVIENAEKLVECGVDPLRKLYRFFGATTNRHVSDILKLLSDPVIGSYLAEQYWKNFDGSFYGNTMNLITEVINGLEEKRGFDSILDVASGPCCLARSLGRPVVSLDANAEALRFGRSMLGEKAGDGLAASFTDIPAKDRSFDLIVFSLGFLHSAPHEREDVLRELNRVMEEEGVVIITTPCGEGRYEKLAQALPKLGFDVLTDITGTAQSSEKKDFECMIISAVKRGEPQEGRLPIELFDFGDDRVESESWEASISRSISKKVCRSFEIDSVAADEAARNSVKGLSPKEVKKVKEVAEVSAAEKVEPLLRRYGQLGRIPQEELDALGVAVVKVGKGKKSYYTVVMRDDLAEMKERHNGFVRMVKEKRPSGKPKGRRTGRR